MDDYYDSVLRQKVPAGPVVVLATVNVGTGPAPEVPDLAGDLPCRLGIDVQAGGEVAVEVNLDGGADCLRQPAPAADEGLIQAFLPFSKHPSAGTVDEGPLNRQRTRLIPSHSGASRKP